MFLLPEEPRGGAEEEEAGAGAHTGGGPGQLEIPWTALKYVTGEVRVTRKKRGGCGCQPRCTGMQSPWHVCEIESPRLHPPACCDVHPGTPATLLQINYGGRVTDDNDRRLLMCILERCYSPQALIAGHAFTASGAYRSPPDSALAAYLPFVRQLPQQDEPEVFGLHANANITFNIQVGARYGACQSGGTPRCT